MQRSYAHQASEKRVLLSSLALSELGKLAASTGKRALAGPDGSAVAAAVVAGAILSAGRGWGAETGGGEVTGRRQSRGRGECHSSPGWGVSADGSVCWENCVVCAPHWEWASQLRY